MSGEQVDMDASYKVACKACASNLFSCWNKVE